MLETTLVSYPAGELEAVATVQAVHPAGDGLLAIITDATPFHPIDTAWPDQPADAGELLTGGATAPIVEAVIGADNGTEFFLGADVPVRTGTEGWSFVVAHLVAADTVVAPGDRVSIRADAATRRSLSIGHTACHLAALALNRELAGYWSKDARTDALGAPDFDGIALSSSRITHRGSLDRFRLNKSLRRAGFDLAVLQEPGALDRLAASVDATLAAWVRTGGDVRIERDGERLTDRRTWVVELADGEARMSCGGTHATSLGELGEVHVSFMLGDDNGTPIVEMSTRTNAA